MMQNVKLVTVGDGTVGKTSLLMSYTENRFPIDYVPTVFDNFTTGVEVDGRLVNFALWDTAGQEEYAKLRSLSYPDTDVFLICFALNSSASYSNVKDKWAPEISHYCPSAKVILVGTKMDLRPQTSSSSGKEEEELKSKGFISAEMGRKLAEEIGAHAYFECSALTQQGLSAVFDGAIRAVPSPLEAKKKINKKRKNCILF